MTEPLRSLVERKTAHSMRVDKCHLRCDVRSDSNALCLRAGKAGVGLLFMIAAHQNPAPRWGRGAALMDVLMWPIRSINQPYAA